MHDTAGMHSPGHQMQMAVKVLGTAKASSVPHPECPVLMADQIKTGHTKHP